MYKYETWQRLTLPLSAQARADFTDTSGKNEIVVYNYYSEDCADDEHTIDGPKHLRCCNIAPEIMERMFWDFPYVRYNICPVTE